MDRSRRSAPLPDFLRASALNKIRGLSRPFPCGAWGHAPSRTTGDSRQPPFGRDGARHSRNDANVNVYMCKCVNSQPPTVSTSIRFFSHKVHKGMGRHALRLRASALNKKRGVSRPFLCGAWGHAPSRTTPDSRHSVATKRDPPAKHITGARGIRRSRRRERRPTN